MPSQTLYAPGATNVPKLNPTPYDPSTPLGSYNVTVPSATTDWTVVGSNDTKYEQEFKRRAFRAAFVAEFSNFGGKLKSKAIFGYDWSDNRDFYRYSGYYLADANGKIYVDPTKISNNLSGRIPLWGQWYNVGNGPAVFARPNTLKATHFLINGNNWVLAPLNGQGLFPVTPSNPHGLRLTNPGNGDSFTYQSDGAIFGGMTTDWFNDRVQTLMSLRRDTYGQAQWNPGQPVDVAFSKVRYVGNIGANFRAVDWFRPYVNVSTSSTPPSPNATYGPFGDPLPIEHSSGEQLGAKFTLFKGSVNGTLEYYGTHVIGHNTNNGDAGLANPAGLNGRANGISQNWVPVDYNAKGLSLQLSGNPTKNWRTMVRLASTDGTVLNNMHFAQVYNDQFYANGNTVTYKNGTPVMVDPTTVAISSAANAIPLAISMMNDRTSAYWWNPSPQTGTTQNNSLSSLLTNPGAALVTANGPIVTGAAGLPSSARQIAWDDPFGFGTNGVDPVKAGRKTIGYAQYQIQLTNNYSFSTGLLKGFQVGGVTMFSLKQRNSWINWPLQYNARGQTTLSTNYANSSQQPAGLIGPGRWYRTNQGLLWGLPDNYLINAWLKYSCKIGSGRFRFETQLNINNLLNHTPSIPTPFSGTLIGETRGFTLLNTPRDWGWTNTISF